MVQKQHISLRTVKPKICHLNIWGLSKSTKTETGYYPQCYSNCKYFTGNVKTSRSQMVLPFLDVASLETVFITSYRMRESGSGDL